MLINNGFVANFKFLSVRILKYIEKRFTFNIPVRCTSVMNIQLFIYKYSGALHLAFQPQSGEILVEQKIATKSKRCRAPKHFHIKKRFVLFFSRPYLRSIINICKILYIKLSDFLFTSFNLISFRNRTGPVVIEC